MKIAVTGFRLLRSGRSLSEKVAGVSLLGEMP